MTSVSKTVGRAVARVTVISSVIGLAALTFVGGPNDANAGDKSPTFVGKVAPSPKPAPAKAKTAVESDKAPFDVSELPAIDRETEKAIAAVDEACVASPMSREGPTPQETARCNLAISRVVARGKAGASAILTALNDVVGAHPYYARAQLYVALGKIDDPKARSVLIGGLEKIGRSQLVDHVVESWVIQETLFAMFGAGPEATAPWEPTPSVSDGWEEAKLAAAEWRKVETAWAGKKRNEVLITRLTSAKKEKTSDDPTVAYRAVAYLVKQAPREAKLAGAQYAKRKGLAEEVAAAFEDLSSEADFRASIPAARL